MRALSLVVLVGCAGDGVIVEVDTAGLGVTSVELVLSDRICEDPLRGGDCASIQGPNFKLALGQQGDIFSRDASAKIVVEDGLARFELPSEDNVLRMGFALGRDAQGVIVGSAVMDNTLDLSAGPVIYRVALDPTEPLRERLFDPSRAAAAQWGEGDRCVGVQPLRTTVGQRPFFILPDDDPDCDGRHTTDDGECDPLWFDGMLFDENSAMHCAQPSMTLQGAPCVVGHIPQCVEGDVSEIGCVEPPLRCVPDPLCKACATDDTPCQNQLLASPAIETRIDCSIPASITLDEDLGTSCIANGFFIDATSLPTLDGNATCISAEFVKTPNMAIDAEVDSKADFGNARVEIGLVTPACEIKFKWEGTIAAATVTALHSVLVVHVDVSGQRREIWLPINFRASTACAEPTSVSTCTFQGAPGADAITACLR